jgi:hypothetical protein
MLPLKAPRLKFLTVANVPPGTATLNWKVNGPEFVSVASAIQSTMAPIGCGDFNLDDREAMLTVAIAGPLISGSAANTKHHPKF